MRAPIFPSSLLRCCAVCAFSAAVLSAPCVFAARFELDAPSDLAPLLKTYVSVFQARPSDDALDGEESGLAADETLAQIRRARREIPALLDTEGYFSPRLRFDRQPDGSVRVVVAPGARAVVKEVKIEFRGALAGDDPVLAGRRQALAAAWSLPADSPFRQADWAAAKDRLLAVVAGRDFAAAKLVSAKADIDPESAQARLNVVIDSGPAFKLGALKVSGLSIYDRALVARYNTLSEGEPYDYDRLVAFQNALQKTPYFSGAIVEVDRDPAVAAAAPVQLTVSEAMPRRFGAGLGYSGTTGARTELNYRDANAFHRAWELSSALRLEQKRQSLFADLFFPRTATAFRDGVGVAALNEDIANLKTTRYSIAAERVRTLSRAEIRFGLTFQREYTEPLGARRTANNALTLNYGVEGRRAETAGEAGSSTLAGVQIGGGARALLSERNFLRVYVHGQHSLPLGKRATLTLRGETGYTAAAASGGIPQDFLFRTGGAQSVRGYGYQSLGVPSGDAVVGGRALFVSSVEYTRWIRGPWGLATFVDAGDAADTWRAMRLKAGYGVGARWKSPVGPLGVDLAYGQRDRRLRLHFSVAMTF